MGGHYLGDPEGYRPDEDRAAAVARDPLLKLRSDLLADGALSVEAIEDLEAEIIGALDRGVAAAKAGPWPEPTSVTDYVYADPARVQ
jgi:pyruvate dehydrogenase E1 component alpha subunit